MANQSKNEQPHYWGLIPAAGIGQRMRSSVPKQFMHLGKKTILDLSVASLGQHRKIKGICIGLSSFQQAEFSMKETCSKVIGTYLGGATRTETVANGLDYLQNFGVAQDDWVLVHDSNRPLLSVEDVEALIEGVGEVTDGGILCMPVHDTVKYSESNRISKTIPRSNLYRAQTPQMFKLGVLKEALRKALKTGVDVTDESQAIEQFGGLHPVLIQGHYSNIKITKPEDLELAKFLMKSVRRNSTEKAVDF